MLALVFTETGRFPSEVMKLSRGERGFLFAALIVKNEESAKSR
jgi:hypothetical protein